MGVLSRPPRATRRDACGPPREPVDLYADFHDVTLAVTTRALFGVDAFGGGGSGGAGVVAAVDAAFAHLAGAGASILRLPGWVPTPGCAAFEAAVASLDAAVHGIIAARRAERARAAVVSSASAPASAAPPSCLLDALLDADATTSDTALRDQLVTMLTAGAETSAIALAWAASLLAAHPETLATATAAVDAAIGDRPVAASDAGALTELEAIMLETLRLMPPAYIVGRCASTRAHLAGFTLPPGTTLLVSPWLLHRDPRVWHAPRSFVPARWRPLLEAAPGDGPGGLRCGRLLAANGGLGPNGAYSPFGAGPRVCVGASLAALEFVTVLAALLQRARLEPVGPLPAAAPTLTLRPAGRVEVRLTPR